MPADRGLAAVVLAAGEGRRLRPLTSLLPKALCPVGGVPLVDWALSRVGPHVGPDEVAVNAHAHRDQMVAHLRDRVRGSPEEPVHVSIEEPVALGTAGALGRLRSWLDGRDVLVTNADAWCRFDLAAFVSGWDRERMRLLVTVDAGGADFGPWRYAGTALLPATEVAPLLPEPSGLYELLWGKAEAEGRLDLVPFEGAWFDCGTPSSYLAANMAASGGSPVVGSALPGDAVVERSVVWDGAQVAPGEVLVDAIRPRSGWTIHVGAAA